jgi:CheY-like chemotaxis protein
MEEGTILIVDDEKIIRDLLCAMLKEAGDYKLLTAINGKEALQICMSEENIDLVFSDLRMPVMSGMELLVELRKNRPDIPVVILTGYGRREDVIEALRLGASNFLLKPQEVDMVYTVASKILRMRHQEKMEKMILDFFVEDHQMFSIPNDLHYTLPIIDLLTDKISILGICNEAELTNLRFALDEALVNAVVHGNLEIQSSAKGATLDEMMQFNNLVKKRSLEPGFSDRKVTITRHLTNEFVIFSIEDQGRGFDWRTLPMTLDEMEILSNYGRGLFLIRAFMTRVEFNDKGNRITLVKEKPDSHTNSNSMEAKALT